MNPIPYFDEASCIRMTLALAHALWQGGLVALAAGVIAGVVLRKASPRARYGLYVVALLATALCPVAMFVYLGRDAVTPALVSTAIMPTPTEAPSGILAASAEGAAGSPNMPPLSSPRERGESASSSPSGRGESIIPSPLPRGDTGGASVSTTHPLASAFVYVGNIDWRPYAPYATAAYLVGCLLMIARLTLGLRGGRRLRQEARPVTDRALLDIVARQARALGLALEPAVAFCERVIAPTVVGAIRPMILLPMSLASGLTPAQIEFLIRHELAHICRYDPIVNVVQRIIEALLFYHPAVWHLSRRVRIEREHCCDDLVLAAGGDAVAYANSLVMVAELSVGRRAPAVSAALAAADRPSQLRRRILRLLGRPGPQVRLSRMGLLGLLLTVSLLFTVIAYTASCGNAQSPRSATSNPSAAATPAHSVPDAAPTEPTASSPVVPDAAPTEPTASSPVAPVAAPPVEASANEPTSSEPVPTAATPAVPGPSSEATRPAPVVEGSLDALVLQLRDPDWWLRQVAAQKLCEVAIAKESTVSAEDRAGVVVRALIQALKDTDARVQQAAAESLGKLGDPAAIKHLVAVLKSEQPALRTAASEALAQFHQPEVFDLLGLAIRDKEPLMRLGAIEALGKNDPKQSVPILVTGLGTVLPHRGERGGPGRERMILMDTLAKLPAESVTGPLIAALASSDRNAADGAAEVLGMVGGDQAKAALLAAARDPNAPARLAAMQALGPIPGDDVTSALVEWLSSANWDVMRAAGIALQARGYAPRTDEETARLTLARGQDWSELGQVPPASRIEPLLLALEAQEDAPQTLKPPQRGNDFSIRGNAVAWLSGIHDPRAFRALLDVLDDPRADLRGAALKGVERLATRDSVPDLIPHLANPDPEVRKLLIGRIAKLAPAEGFDALVKALTDPSADVRAEAARVLGELADPRALEPLTGTLKDLEPSVRAAAVLALGQLKDARAFESLVSALKDSAYEVRAGAMRGLGQLADPRAAEALVAALDDASDDARNNVTYALQHLGDSAVPSLAAALANSPSPETRRVVAGVLAAWGDVALPYLIKATQDPDPGVRESVCYSLGRFKDPTAVVALTAVAKNPSESLAVRRAAISALQSLAQPTGDPPNPSGQLAAAPAIEPLIAVFNETSDPQLKESVAEALAAIGDPKAIEPLESWLKAQGSTQNELVAAVRRAVDQLRRRPAPEPPPAQPPAETPAESPGEQ